MLRKLALLGALYVAEGLPFGFQAKALPAYLRSEGVSLTAIGFVGMLSLPWILKPLWAPLVEGTFSPRWGRRRSWILPMLAGLVAVTAAAGFVDPDRSLALLLVLVGLMNLLAATMDIAVDGWAVDLLDPAELGPGNTVQVVGYKVGMLTGGGLLVWASGRIGWSGLFGAMSALIALVFVATLAVREHEPSDAGHDRTRSVTSFRSIVRRLAGSLRHPGAGWVIVLAATYKVGEAMADAMFKPFLVDAGFDVPTIGLWVGTYGTVFSIAGSIAGGALAARWGVAHALIALSMMRCIPLMGQVWLTTIEPTSELVVAITSTEHFFGGCLTTAMFAFMMSRVDREIGATHFTLLAAVEVLGKSPGAWASGVLADALGFGAVFGVAALLSMGFSWLLIHVRARSMRSAE